MDKRENFFDLNRPDVIIFTFQILLIFIVVCVSLLNLTFQWGNLNSWTVILTGSLGYIMPNPRIRADIENLEAEKNKTNNAL